MRAACIGVLAVLCLSGAALAAPTHSHELTDFEDEFGNGPPHDDGPGMQTMLASFVKGQRGLIAEMKVATLMVANTVMPGFDFDVTVNTTIAHPNQNATCPHPPVEFQLFIENQFATWIQMLHNIVAGVSYVGAQVGNTMVDDQMIATFMSSRKQFANYPDANGGSGFGMGFQVLCGYNQIFSFGGGGGGGAGQK